MLHYYSVKNLLSYFQSDSNTGYRDMSKRLKGERVTNWINMGGQLIPEKDVDQLRADINSGKLNSWLNIHNRYNEFWNNYTFEKQKHSYSVLCYLYNTSDLSREQWNSAIDKSVQIQEYISEQVYISRNKDFDNKFRQATFRNYKEMAASIGTIDENSFVKQVREETKEYQKLASEIKARS